MSTNIRISLTILSVGFGIEGSAEAYSLLTRGSFLMGTSLLFVFPVVVTLLGLLFILIGRQEWNELHRTRIRQANLIFGLSVMAGVVALVELGLLTYYSGLGSPLWAQVLLGFAVGGLVLGTFVTYAHLVFHLVRRPSKMALAASALWALIVSAYIGQALGADLPKILSLIAVRSFSIGVLLAPVDYLSSLLFVSYFLLLIAYLDAHFIVARGRQVEGASPAIVIAEVPGASPESRAAPPPLPVAAEPSIEPAATLSAN